MKSQMKSKNFLIKEIKLIIKKQTKKNVKETSKIYDFVSWDSLANFNILLECEKKFKIKFSPQEFNKLNSFKEILKIVTKKFK